MNRLYVVSILWLSGCLPAYDNREGAITVPADLATPSGDGAADMGGADLSMTSGCAGSSTYIYGSVYNLDLDYKGSGVILNIEGSTCPPSAPSTASGQVMAEIPQNLVGTSAYLYFTGTFGGSPIPKNWFAPKGLLDSTASLTATYHFIGQDMNGIVSQSLASLISHGDIASGTTTTQFLNNYSFMLGLLLEHNNAGEKIFKNYSVQVNSLSNASCNLSMQCCVYYAPDIQVWMSTHPTPNFIDFGATTSPLYFEVICPASQTGDITLNQTAATSTLGDQQSKPPSVPFSPIQVPRKPGDVVSIEWFNN